MSNFKQSLDEHAAGNTAMPQSGPAGGFTPSFSSRKWASPLIVPDLMERPEAWRTHVVSTLQGLDEIAAEWRYLESNADQSATAFQSFDWCRAHLAGNAPARFAIVCVYRRGELVLVLPLSIHRRFGVAVATWLGDPFTQYGDVLIDRRTPRQDALDAAFKALSKIAGLDALTLRKVRHDATILEAGGMAGAIPAGDSQSAILELAEFKSLECYRKTLKSKQRSNRKRVRRKLNEAGKVKFEIVTGRTAMAQTVDEAITFKTRWLAERGLMSRAAFCGNPFGILQRLVASPNAGFETIVSRLSVDGVSAAIEVGFLWNNCYFAYLGSFNPEFAAMSPGTIQMEDTISWLIEKGVASYDLFAPMDHYKQQWSNTVRPVSTCLVALSARGWLYSNMLEGRILPKLRQTWHILPGTIRHRAAKLIMAHN